MTDDEQINRWSTVGCLTILLLAVGGLTVIALLALARALL